ncbi:MAG: HD domain-containing phosphohydrolase [Verrucomicrobiota bacterium]
MSEKILFVDDDANILAAYQRNLRKQFTLDAAPGGEQALAAMETQGPYAVVVADMQMPGMNGIQFLLKVKEKAPDAVRIMLTGNADQQTAVEAVNKGHVFQFLTKPCPPQMLALALEAGIKQYRLVTSERDLLEKTLSGSIKVLTDILSMIDPQTFGRAELLRDYTRTFVKSLKINQTWEFEVAAMLSQIGFVTIPPGVIQKARAGHGLSGQEKDMLTRVPNIGAELLSNIPRLDTVGKIVLYQNKNYDGSGFPVDSIAGEDIPVGSRILKVLSDLLELETKETSKAIALSLMQNRPGQYDPRVLDAAFACFDVYLPQATSAKSSGRSIGFKELQAGHILISNIETSEGMMIVTAGNKISPLLLQKLRNFAAISGIKEPIYVED